jgi:hypothetical protein
MKVQPTEDCVECAGHGLKWNDWSGPYECGACIAGQVRARDSRGRWLPSIEVPDDESELENADVPIAANTID